MPKRAYPSLSSITNEEWDFAEEKAQEKIKGLKANFTGFIKIDRKNYPNDLNNSFRVYVENGKIKHTFATARKKIVEVDRLGEGAFGEVACCKTRDGHIFAAKYQKNKKIDTEMQLLETVNEVVAHGSYTSQTKRNRHFAVMKLKEGSELFKKLYPPILFFSVESWRNIKLTHTQQLVFAIKCLRIVEFLHTQGIVHRDLKPENIMVRFGEGNLKDIMIVSVIDLGLAKKLKPNETERSNVSRAGTPYYMAPEVEKYNKKDRVLTPKNDIYSLGIMFFADLEMNDNFIENMLNQDYNTRFDATQCRKHFENKLKKHLRAEFRNKGIAEAQLDEKINAAFDAFFTPDEKLKEQLDAADIDKKLNYIKKKNAITRLYDKKITLSFSGIPIFGRIFQNEKRIPQMEAIQHVITKIADGDLSPQKKYALLHDFAVHVQTKISAIHPHSRLARVMDNLATEIERLNMLPENVEQKAEPADEDAQKMLIEYISNIEKEGLSEYAKAELDALMQLDEKSSAKLKPE